MCATQCEPLAKILRAEMDENQIEDVFEALNRLPKLSLSVSLALGEDKPILKLPYEGTLCFQLFWRVLLLPYTHSGIFLHYYKCTFLPPVPHHFPCQIVFWVVFAFSSIVRYSSHKLCIYMGS